MATMPLYLNGRLVSSLPATSDELFELNPEMKQNADRFASRTPKVIESKNVLYVAQREFAIAFENDKNIKTIGSDDATTCLIVCLRHNLSGLICISHFDGCGLKEGITAIITKIESLSSSFPEKYEIDIVGGFNDDNNVSEHLIMSFLHELNKQPSHLNITTMCIGNSNTITKDGVKKAIVYGLGFNMKNGDIFPAIFPEKGPEMALRCARLLTGSKQMLDIYDTNWCVLSIGPFDYEPLRGRDLWLSQSDSFLLKHLSTSPDAEPPHFVSQIRAALRHVQLHPFPRTTIFPRNEPVIYAVDSDGVWRRRVF